MSGNNDQIIGDYKIEVSPIYDSGAVRKALGPWPLRNWSWITFYNGSAADCREYALWAARIDAGDKLLLAHAWTWMRERLRRPPTPPPQRGDWANDVLHLPKTWGYDFKQALALPKAEEAPGSDFSGELLAVFLMVIALLVFGFFYHST